MSANNIQIAGDHYRNEYQHWDFVIDCHLHYIPANATKYIGRWRKKNGLEDLKKSLHYLTKAIENKIHPSAYALDFNYKSRVERFTSQLIKEDAIIIRHICHGCYESAVKLIEELIEETEFQEEISLARSRDGV